MGFGVLLVPISELLRPLSYRGAFRPFALVFVGRANRVARLLERAKHCLSKAVNVWEEEPPSTTRLSNR
jgi:hypothetical protein